MNYSTKIVYCRIINLTSENGAEIPYIQNLITKFIKYLKCIWKNRNSKIFEARGADPITVADQAWREIELWKIYC